MTAPQDRIEELRAILAELETLGEPPPEDLEAELRQAEALQDTLVAIAQGSHSLEAMPLPTEDDLDALQDPLRAMHRIRAAAGADTLRPLDQRRLLKGIRDQNIAREAPRTNTHYSILLGVAAALLLVSAALIYLLAGQGLTKDSSTTTVVAQVELQRAEDSLRTTEAESLQALMRATPSANAGDHGLRQLRQARHRATSARQHAHARRL